MIVALDACTIIYLVEGSSSLAAPVMERVTNLLADPAARIVCSRLARLECRVGPLRAKDTALLTRYDEFFGRDRVFLMDITAPVVERATALRADQGFRVADAIHLATALEAAADLFLTGDRRLAQCPGLRVELIGSSVGEAHE